VPKNPHKNIETENHEDENVRVQRLGELPAKLLLVDPPVQIRRSHHNSNKQLDQKGPSKRANEKMGYLKEKRQEREF
jgi:hypothetical protein